MKDDIVQNISHKLFLERTGSLESELTEQELSFLLKEKLDGCHLKNDKLIFSSYEDRDKYVVQHYFSKINIAHIEAEKTIITTAFDIWNVSLRGDYSTAGLFLSLYEDKINIWKELITSDRNQYEITSLADQFIKHTKDIDIKTLFDFFSTIYNKYNEYIATCPHLDKRLATNPQKCHEIINKFHTDIRKDTVYLYNIALFSLQQENYSIAIDILLSDINKNDIILSTQSLWVLGRIINKRDVNYKDSETSQIIVDKISSPIPEISRAAIQAAINTVEKTPKLRDAINRLLKEKNTESINLLCKRILITKELRTDDDFIFWMTHICANADNNKKMNESIFHIFSSLTEDISKHVLLTDFLFIMLRKNPIAEYQQELKHFLYSVTKHSDLTNKLFTLALVNDDPNIANFAPLLSTHLMVNSNPHVLNFCLSIINYFTEKDFVFIVRRSLGFISNEKHLITIILSMLKVDNAKNRTYNLVKTVIINEIGMDYPFYVINEIKSYKKNTEQCKLTKKIYGEILPQIEKHVASFTALPRIKELEPSSAHTLSFQKERDRKMAKEQEIAHEDSFVFQIAARIQLKAGIASFHYNEYNNTGYSEPSFLQSFSSSYSLPSRYVMDNVGYAIRTIRYKTAKKDTA